MAALFHTLFGCCFGERQAERATGNGETDPLLPPFANGGDDNANGASALQTGFYDEEERAQELKQKVADIVSIGTRRMLNPVVVRGNPVYSTNPATASSSQGNLPVASSLRLQAQQPLGAHQRSDTDSRQSSHSSRHSSYRHHQPTLLPHPESDVAQPDEDGVSPLDGLANPQALNEGATGGNTSLTSTLGDGSTGLGASATGRRFQIHRGRPPSRKKVAENGADVATQNAQRSGQPSGSEAGDKSTSSPARQPRSPPRTINNPKNEEASAERRQVHFKLPPGDLLIHYDD